MNHTPTLHPPPAERWSDSVSYRAAAAPEPIRSVLLLKLDHVGDFILALDAIAALRHTFPDAVFDLACGPWNADFARALDLFDHVFPIPFFVDRADRERPPFSPAILGPLVARRYDLAIDLRVDHDTRIVLRHLQARYKAGFESSAHDAALTLVIPHHVGASVRANIGVHQSLVMLRLAHGVADVFAPTDQVAPLLRGRLAQPCDLDLSLARGRVLVVCNTSSGRAAKNWPPDRFQRLIRWLAIDLDAVVLLVGSPDQAPEAHDIIQFCGTDRVISAVGLTTLGQATHLIGQASLFIGNDSGLTHLAARLGVPTVAIYSGIDPVAAWAPFGDHVTVLRAPVACSPCHILHLDQCRGAHACVLNIAEPAVRAAVRHHLMTARRYTDPDLAGDPPIPVRQAPAYRGLFCAPRAHPPRRHNNHRGRHHAHADGLRLDHLLHGFSPGGQATSGDLNRFYMLALAFDQISREAIVGDIAELGVHRGNTAYLLADLARRTGATAYLLDPFADRADDLEHTTLSQVRAHVGTESTIYLQGHFPATAARIPAAACFALVHIDLHAAHAAALDFFYHRMVPGGFIIMHDHNDPPVPGGAVDRFFADKPEFVVPIPDSAGSLIVRRAGRATGNR